VAVVNEAFARKFFRGVDPLGKYFGRAIPGDQRRYRIVGIAKDARYLIFDLDKPASPFFFLPEAQHDFSAGHDANELDPGSHYMQNIVVVAKPGATVSFDELRRTLASIDPNLPITSIRALRDQVVSVFRQQRLIARVTSVFGLLSLLLSSIGLYGVAAYNAVHRTREIGLRMALGADRRDAIALVLKGAFGLVCSGLALGVPLALATGQILEKELYGINPFNVVISAISVLILLTCGSLASLVPAVRASSILPSEALRLE
jgi:hypothetical protein